MGWHDIHIVADCASYGLHYWSSCIAPLLNCVYMQCWVYIMYWWLGRAWASPTLVGSLCIRRSVMLCAECEQKNPIEKPFKFCICRSVTLCAECEQQNPIEKPSKFCMRLSVTLCTECEQKNPIEKPSKFCMRRSVTLCTECEQKNPIEKAIQVLYASERHVVRGMWTIYRIFNEQSIRSSVHTLVSQARPLFSC